MKRRWRCKATIRHRHWWKRSYRCTRPRGHEKSQIPQWAAHYTEQHGERTWWGPGAKEAAAHGIRR